MKSKQINFYMMPEDVAELDEYIKQQGLVIVAYSNSENHPKILDTIVNLIEPIAYFILPENSNTIKLDYIESRKNYVVNCFYASCIEYRKTFYAVEENKMRPGKLYFNSMMYNLMEEWIEKDEQTILLAEKLFNWYRKHFKNTKINSEFTTQRVANLVQQKRVELLLNQ